MTRTPLSLRSEQGRTKALAKYQNKLGLSGIPRIRELVPQQIGSFFGLFYRREDEFIHFAEMLKRWKRQRKSLADYVQDEAHREALLRDLYQLRDWIALELRREKSKPPPEQALQFLERREFFLMETVPYEESRLLAWAAPPAEEIRFDYASSRGALIYQSGAVSRMKLQIKPAGRFSLFWKQAGEKTGAGRLLAAELPGGGQTMVNLQLLKPCSSGEFHLHNERGEIVERIPA